MNECDERKSHKNNKLHTICISSNNGRHPVTKTFTTLHYTSPNYTSLHVNLSSLQFLSFKLHPTTLHSTSLQLSTLHLFSFKLHPTKLHSTSLQLSTLHLFSFKLHPPTLHYPLIWLNTVYLSYRSTSPHFTSGHF